MKFQGFVGPAYTLPSVNVDCQRCVNFYPELIESGTGKEAQVAYLKSTPGLTKLMEIGTGPIRMIHLDNPPKHGLNPRTRIFVASGADMYQVTKYAGSWVVEHLGVLSSSTGPMRAASAQINLGVTIFVDGVNTYLYQKFDNGDGGAIVSFGTFANYFGAPAPFTATHIVWIDGYFIYNNKDTGQFYVSEWNAVDFNPLSFASAEGDLDNIVAMIANNRELILFNERTTEIFTDVGNADMPFERVAGGFIEKGCAAGSSIAKIDGFVFWIGRDELGHGIIYNAKGMSPNRISTHAIESAMQTYADITTATAYTYQSGGHSFYVLNFAEATWVYDLSTSLWHERAWTNADGDLVRHRAECVAFIPEFGLHLVGDWENNKVYQFDELVYKDDTSPITRLRTTPHVSNGLKRLFFKSLQLDMETGVGLDGAVQGSDPQVMMDYSNDGGHTWSDEAWASAGKKIGGIGNFKARVIWRRLGSAFDRVFRIKLTDPVPVTLLSVELDVESER